MDTTIVAMDYFTRDTHHVPWERPGPLPEKALLCAYSWIEDLAAEEYAAEHGAAVCARLARQRVDDKGVLIALLPASSPITAIPQEVRAVIREKALRRGGWSPPPGADSWGFYVPCDYSPAADVCGGDKVCVSVSDDVLSVETQLAVHEEWAVSGPGDCQEYGPDYGSYHDPVVHVCQTADEAADLLGQLLEGDDAQRRAIVRSWRDQALDHDRTAGGSGETLTLKENP